MTWRLHLTNQAIQYINILDGNPPLLAVWSRRDKVAYYTLQDGTLISEDRLLFPETENRQGDDWQTFLGELTTPNNAYLPVIEAGDMTILATDDGRMHLYHLLDEAELYLQTDGKEVKLDTPENISLLTVALDRFLGLVAAVDAEGKLSVFQQHIKVGRFDLNLTILENPRPTLAISRGGGAIVVSDGRQILISDSGGKIRKQQAMHYDIYQMACSPNGRYIVTSDPETGVIRVYDGQSLTLYYQRFALDLIAKATQVQLLADLPPTSVVPTSLTINDAGDVAFAMSGVVCVSNIQYMDPLPRAQELL